jgi:integrase
MAAGTIRKRETGRGTRWQAIVDLGPDPTTGRRRQRSRFCDTEREAKKALAKLQTEADAGLLAQRSAQTVGDLCTHWLDTHARFKAPGTYAQYSRDVRLHVIPHLGAVKAHALSPAMVRSWIAARLAAGTGASALRQALTRLHAALEQARSDRVIPTNPTSGIRVPRPGADDWGHERHTWTSDEARRFLLVTQQPGNAPYGPVFVVSLATGMRLGELLGLRWADVDTGASPDGGILHVRHAMREDAGGPALGPLKTKSARRDVLIPPPVSDALRTHRAQQAARRLRLGPAWNDHDLVFASSIGTPLRRMNIWRHYQRLLGVAGVPKIRIHDHRHTHITWALEEHADIKAVSARVGHSSTRITSEIYQRVTDQLARDVVDKTAAKLFAVPEKAPESAPQKRLGKVLRPHLRPRRRAAGS